MKYIIISFFVIFFYFYRISINYRNPYKLVMIFGKKGSGKNTLLTKLSVKYNKMNYHVFSDSEIYNTYKLSTDWIGKYDFPENSVLMIEEAGITWDNRNFKTFSKEVRDFFKLQRHHHIIVYLASQSFDVDKKLRDLTDEMYLCVNIMGIFSIAKRINKRIAIHNSSDNNDGESFLTETYSFDFPWNWIYTYIPRWVQFFNSFEVEKTGNKAPRDRYTFIKENELHKQTHWSYYKLYQIQSFIQSKENKMAIEKKSFKLSHNWFNFCSDSNNYIFIK